MSSNAASDRRTVKDRVPNPDMSVFKPPKAPLARLRFRWSMWAGGTFSSSMLETWEVVVLVILTGLFFLLLAAGIFRYLPNQMVLLAKRVHYYLMGTDSPAEAQSVLKYTEL